MNHKILPRSFYNRDTPEVAQDLLGKLLVRKLPDGTVLTGVISETEAYRSDDPACHAYARKTERNRSLFGPVGHAYVYMSYGLHFCLNLVSFDSLYCKAGGVLIRAIVPISGLDIMIKNRRILKPLPFSSSKPASEIGNLIQVGLSAKITNGPGKVTQALAITRELDGIDVTCADSQIFITEYATVSPKDILVTPRIGISKATETLWRFLLNRAS